MTTVIEPSTRTDPQPVGQPAPATPDGAAARGGGDGGLVRVTVVCGERRTDLALPGALTVAELVPDVARSLGVLDPLTAYAGYELVGTDGHALSGELALGLQGVEDGQVLTLLRGVDQEHPRVYDDIVEAMADAVEQDTRPWDPAAGRRTALASSAILLGLGAVALAFQRPDVVAGAAAGVAALLLVTAAVVVSRLRAEHAAALTLAWSAVGYAVVSGLTAVPSGQVLELPLALGGVGALVVGAVGVVGLVEHRAAMIPAIAVGAVAAAGSGVVLLTGLAPAAVYAVALVTAVVAGSALPWFAIGATGTRVEQAHGAEDLTAEPAPISPERVRQDVRLGHDVLLGVTATVGLLLVLVSPLAVGLGLTGTLLCVCGSVVTMLRTRQYRVGSEVAAGLGCGVAGLVAVAGAILVEHRSWDSGLAVVLAITAVVLLVLTLVPLAPSVRRGRLGDVAELVALVGMLPLLVLAIGLVTAVQT